MNAELSVAEILALPLDQHEAAILAVAEQIPAGDARAAIVAHARDLFAVAAKTSQGRAMLRKQRAIAVQRLKTETEWAEVSWAAWVLRQCASALARPIKPSETAAHKQKRLNRIVHGTSFACHLLQRWAFSPERENLPSASRFDLGEAWGIMSRLYRIAGGDMTKRPRQ